MLLVLTGVTAISVALLAYVNELTKEPIAAANAKTLSDAVKAVVPGFDNDPIAEKKMQEVDGVEYAVYPATKGGEYIGAAVEASAMGFGGELKVLVVNGECPVEFTELAVCESTLYTLQYIAASPIEKLYTFTVSEQVLGELKGVLRRYRDLYMEGHFKSLEILEACVKSG